MHGTWEKKREMGLSMVKGGTRRKEERDRNDETF